jgi:hypothetical protein
MTALLGVLVTGCTTGMVQKNAKAPLNGKTEVVDTTTGDATAANVASGKKAWVDGVEVTGTPHLYRLMKTPFCVWFFTMIA